ncbi:ABC transporter ATP-binding protein [Nocardioides seonyuensis]|uniref:ABC-type quaternary amine transporter n=1 Tax=Nocardioides seonyuensis TaxID=2518371 RepID=A0A4P7IHR8_9ACTN|nr:ABC transporter ATP-binding protein [Nocardioides seonyuensis]QBX56270.1 ABC transporter ATP-binding protein [Nocardioides seonyuensis]
MSSVDVKGVSKTFPQTRSGTATRAVDDVTLHVPNGSLTAVLGPSGCGKTTLLRLIAGFLVPDSGTIAFDDRVVAGQGRPVPPQARRVGYVPQEGALFPHLDVAGNIGFGLAKASRRPGADVSERVLEMLDLVELPREFATRAPHELSGGQQQRVALARALAPSPSIVLLDEPFSSLDAALRESTGRAVARALRVAGATGLLVTHDQSEALSLSDQVAVLREGRLIQAGSPADVYMAPQDPELARFVGGASAVPGRAVSSGLSATCALGTVRLTAAPSADDLVLVLRPDQVVLVDDGVEAEVAEVSFYGHDAAVRLSLVGQHTALVARVPGPTAPTVGDVVRVGVRGAVHAYPAPVRD